MAANQRAGGGTPEAVLLSEVVQRLGLDKSDVMRLIRDGDLTPVHVGRKALVPIAEFERLNASPERYAKKRGRRR